MISRWVAVMLVAQLFWPLAVRAQAPAPAPATPTPGAAAAVVPTIGVPGNPTNPADTINNPHPTMPWFGIPTPYGQFLRWVWMPPQPIVAGDQVLYEPGFWAAQTTAGYYYPARWVLQEVSPGTFAWVLVDGGAVPFAR